jgi:hypothetical protein
MNTATSPATNGTPIRFTFSARRLAARCGGEMKTEESKMGYDMKGAAMIALAKQGNEAAQRAAYLDYVNNFLTVAGFASYYGMAPRSAETYLAWWRDVHEAHCAALAGLAANA